MHGDLIEDVRLAVYEGRIWKRVDPGLARLSQNSAQSKAFPHRGNETLAQLTS